MNIQTMGGQINKVNGADFKPVFGKDANGEDNKPNAELHKEGPLAKMIEQQTAKLPSDLFLWLAGGSIATSLTLKLMGRDHEALFVGQWAAVHEYAGQLIRG